MLFDGLKVQYGSEMILEVFLYFNMKISMEVNLNKFTIANGK